MTENLLLQHLEDIATRLGVELRYENLGISGVRTDGGSAVLQAALQGTGRLRHQTRSSGIARGFDFDDIEC